ncbi:MAG: T9SS type A sorting domain-containing protein [Prolixibacteraceae bacterium]|nr:T9SS type A sorting domain-containing protein [Prolixibacteraceae bacterium]
MKKTSIISNVIKITFFIFLFLSPFISEAQNAFNTAGGDASGTDGSVSYSIGQIDYTVKSNETGIQIDGVQQPYEIFIIDGVDNKMDINLFASAYPNPASDFLTLKILDGDYSDLTYYLYDVDGKLLISNKIQDNETVINMSIHKPSVYLVKLMSDNKQIKTFKIIKK